MSDTPRTVEQDLGYFGVSLNEPDGGYRPLLLRAREELDRAKGLLSPVICCHCDTEVARDGEWFRCYDCRGHLCQACCKEHFGEGHQPHPKQIQQYETDLSTTRQQLLAAQVEVKRLRDALSDYATCSDGCTCGDGWDHKSAQEALATPPDLSALSLHDAQKQREVLEKILEPIEGGYYQVIGEVKDALNVMLAELDQAPQGEKP